MKYNTVALDMHFYFVVMGAFYCCLFAVQQLLQHFPGLLFPQLVSALPFLPLLTDIMGSVFCCNLLQHLLSCRPALLCWSGSWFGLLAVLSVTPAAACLQPLLFSSRFPDPFADTHSLLWTYLVLTWAEFCEKQCNSTLLSCLKVEKKFSPLMLWVPEQRKC